MAVSIVRAKLTNVRSKIEKALQLLNYKPKKRKIFIKPNIVNGYGSPENGVVTHPLVLEALCQYFKDYEICIGESCAVGQNTDEVLKSTGTIDLAKKYGVRVINLDKEERVSIDWKYGSIKIPKIIYTHEYINVPSFKTHHTTKVSVSIKNQKGLLLAEDKKNFHKSDLFDCIYQLAQIVKPSISIVDGIICLEGNGPGDLTGRKKHMGLIIAGSDLFEVDTVCCRIMGFKDGEIPYIPFRDNVEIKGVGLKDIKSPFLKPGGTLKKYNCHVHSYQTCSGCLESLSMGLNSIKKSPIKILKFIKKGVIGRLDFIVGIKAQSPAKTGKKILCVGHCTKKFAEENQMKFVPGCPPEPERIVEAIL